MNEIRLKIPAHADYVELVRLCLYGIASDMGFSLEAIDDMKVAAAEACNNAVLHANPQGETNFIDIVFEITEASLTIRVKDQGLSFDFQETLARETSLHNKAVNELQTSGLGLFLMQALMDDVTVLTENGTEVILTKHI
ncbi:anti-sigma B factor RsbW [Paenibacillus psychroresistens]|uniref:Anti-sigma B factor RsbW n=1 Tax=Paenibacillus psychroresistens TaxID=1778678 RepID=A0A6B8RST0_9BACL|nr:anti-sigma B factor RsbW [Paenibacillus psychroresistens]QGQ98625.1 anti-sigma B factor RsbW [Paenibacillus psychroresistens]